MPGESLHPRPRQIGDRFVFQVVIVCAAALAIFSAEAPARESEPPNLEGTWMGKLITFDDPRWGLEDILCDRGWCTLKELDYISDLLDNPDNDDMTLDEIKDEANSASKEYITGLFTDIARAQSAQFDQSEDPVNACEPVGFLIQASAQPLPFKIEQFEDRVIFRYEYWDVVRTVHTDGRDHPKNLETSLYGYSVGWYDGPTLVIETRGFEPRLYAVLDVDGLSNTEHAISIERFTRSTDGNQLDQFVTVVDPRMLREPLVSKTSYLSFPDMEFQEFDCKAESGVFETN